MAEEGKNRGNLHNQHQQYYGTFQGVANYYPPPSPQPAAGFPQPAAPQGLPTPNYQYYPQYNATVTGIDFIELVVI